MDLRKVVVKIGDTVVIIEGDAVPIIGRASDPAIFAAAAKILAENQPAQVECLDAEVWIVFQDPTP